MAKEEKQEQNIEQYQRDQSSAQLIENGIEKIQRVLCQYRPTLLCFKAELSLLPPQNEIVSYYKSDRIIDKNEENTDEEKEILAKDLLELIQKQLDHKKNITKTFIKEFCKYRINNITLIKIVNIFKSYYKMGSIKISQEEYDQDLDQIRQGQNLIEQGQDELLHRHQGLVTSIAITKGKLLTPTDRQDLVQDGFLGLLNATDRYNYRRGVCFMTFAYYQVKQNIFATAAWQFKNFKVPLNVIAKIATIASTNQRMSKDLGREPTLSELSKELKMDSQAINEIKLINSRSNNLFDTYRDDNFGDFAEYMPDPDERDITDLINEEQSKKIIADVLNSLDHKSRTILTLRYGLIDDNPMPRDQIGLIFGLTGERIRQLENAALKKLADNKKLQAIVQSAVEQQSTKRKK